MIWDASDHQDDYILRLGNPNLNLYLPLESWEGADHPIDGFSCIFPHRIHLWYIYLHLVDFLMVNVGKYTIYMDGMGNTPGN